METSSQKHGSGKESAKLTLRVSFSSLHHITDNTWLLIFVLFIPVCGIFTVTGYNNQEIFNHFYSQYSSDALICGIFLQEAVASLFMLQLLSSNPLERIRRKITSLTL